MTDDHPLDRLAERGTVRGPGDVLRGVDRAVSSSSRSRTPLRLAVVGTAALALVVGAVELWGSDDTSTSVETADPDGPYRNGVSNRDSVAGFGFDVEDGIFWFTTADSTWVVSDLAQLGGLRGDELSSTLAVTDDGRFVFHDMVESECRGTIVQTGIDGSSDVLVENAVLPALDDRNERLAYASGSECTVDRDLIAVRDLESGQTSTLDVNANAGDGLVFRIDDVEWVGDDIVVLAHRYDGAVVAAASLLRYEVRDDGTVRLRSQVLLAEGSAGAASTSIEAVPGRSDVVVAARVLPDQSSQLLLTGLVDGSEEVLLTSPGEITSFAVRTLTDIFYVTGVPSGTDAGRQVTMYRSVDGEAHEFATDVASIGIAVSGLETATPMEFPGEHVPQIIGTLPIAGNPTYGPPPLIPGTPESDLPDYVAVRLDNGEIGYVDRREYDSFPVVPNIDTGSGESDSAALSKYFDELPPLVLDGYAPDGTVIGTLTLTMQGG